MLSALGIVVGIVSGSQMILFDGVYTLIGITVSWLLLRAADLAAREPTRRYPYGLEAVTPMVIGVQGFVLLGTLAYAASEGVFTIRHGGSDVTAGWGLIYSVVTSAGAAAMWWWLRRRQATSDLLASETLTWRVSALTSIGMVVGFTVLAVLSGSSWDAAGRYVDPVMVLISCVALVPAPLRLLRTTIVELLEGAPSAQVEAPVLAAVREVIRRFDVDAPEVRVAKVGPKLYIEVDATADTRVTIGQQRDVRDALLADLEPLPYDIWLNLELSPREVTSTA